MPTKLQPKKLACIDYLKALAAIFVVIHHSFAHVKVNDANIVYEAIYTLVFCTHVPLFLCIAGYLCHKQPAKPYFKKKILRLLVPFIVFSLLKIVYSVFLDSSHAHGSTIGKQLANAILIGSQYWFIYAILIMYAFAPLFWKLRKGNIVIFVGLVSVGTILEVTDIHLGSYFQLHNTVVYACFFLGGIILQQYQSQLSAFATKRKWLLVTLLPIIIAAILCFILYSGQPVPHFLKVVLAFSMMYLLYLATNALPNNIKPLTFIGKISLQIMLFDSFFRVILFVLIPGNSLTVWPVITLNILLTCVCCLIIKKIPVVRVLFGL